MPDDATAAALVRVVSFARSPHRACELFRKLRKETGPSPSRVSPPNLQMQKPTLQKLKINSCPSRRVAGIPSLRRRAMSEENSAARRENVVSQVEAYADRLIEGGISAQEVISALFGTGLVKAVQHTRTSPQEYLLGMLRVVMVENMSRDEMAEFLDAASKLLVHRGAPLGELSKAHLSVAMRVKIIAEGHDAALRLLDDAREEVNRARTIGPAGNA